MYKIPLAEAKNFIAKAANIKPNTTLPVLAYLRVQFSGQKIILVKNNLKAFIIQSFDTQELFGQTAQFLIDERIFNNFVNSASADVGIELLNATSIRMSDGFTEILSPTEDAAHFPLNYDPDTIKPETICQLDAHFVADSQVAKNFIIEHDIPQLANHVFVGHNFICASDSMIGYKVGTTCAGTICLTMDALNGLKSLLSAQYSENDSYHIFTGEGCVLGFVKTEINFFDLYQKIELPDELPAFTINRESLIKFCNLCSNSSPSRTAKATLRVDGRKILANFTDSEFNVTVDREFVWPDTYECELRFLPANMIRILNNMVCENVQFIPSEDQKRFYITDKERTFTSLIMQIL